MTHILHKAWQRQHPVEVHTALEYALWDCLVEGLGNYRSLSRSWVSAEGELTERAEDILAELAPIFVGGSTRNAGRDALTFTIMISSFSADY